MPNPFNKGPGWTAFRFTRIIRPVMACLKWAWISSLHLMGEVQSESTNLTCIIKLQTTLSQINLLRQCKEVYAPRFQIFTAKRNINLTPLLVFTKIIEKKNKSRQIFFYNQEIFKNQLVHSPKLDEYWVCLFTLLHLNIRL